MRVSPGLWAELLVFSHFRPKAIAVEYLERLNGRRGKAQLK